MSVIEKANELLKNSITLRIVIIISLTILLLIPILIIEDLIKERQSRREFAIEEISSKWGENQIVSSVFLAVPYYIYGKEDEKVKRISERYAYFLPENISISSDIKSEIRYRGIYEAPVYKSDINIKGNFADINTEELGIQDTKLNWEDAKIILGLSDLRGIQEDVNLKIGKEIHTFDPGVQSQRLTGTGLTAKLNINKREDLKGKNFNINLKINGSENIAFVPLGKTTQVKVRSDWSNPSFSGAFLPDNRIIKDEGFKADWITYHLNRNFPQQFKEGDYSFSDFKGAAFGVNLFIPADNYQKSTRATKYGFMIVALTFAVFFFLEIFQKKRLHPIQYIMIGLALVIFYLLLAAFSEHIAFNLSYVIASVLTILLVSLYSKTIFKDKRIASFFSVLLVLVYSINFTLIQLVDFSILIGSIGIFLFLATVMFVSRNIDWYSTQKVRV